MHAEVAEAHVFALHIPVHLPSPQADVPAVQLWRSSRSQSHAAAGSLWRLAHGSRCGAPATSVPLHPPVAMVSRTVWVMVQKCFTSSAPCVPHACMQHASRAWNCVHHVNHSLSSHLVRPGRCARALPKCFLAPLRKLVEHRVRTDVLHLAPGAISTC